MPKPPGPGEAARSATRRRLVLPAVGRAARRDRQAIKQYLPLGWLRAGATVAQRPPGPGRVLIDRNSATRGLMSAKARATCSTSWKYVPERRYLQRVGGHCHRLSQIRPRRLARVQATLRWIVPIPLTHACGYMADIAPRSREVVRKSQWRTGCYVLHVSFALDIGKIRAMSRSSVTRHIRLLLDCQRNKSPQCGAGERDACGSRMRDGGFSARVQRAIDEWWRATTPLSTPELHFIKFRAIVF